MIEFDVETTGLVPGYHELFLVQFMDDSGEPVVLRHPDDAEEIQRWLDRRDGGNFQAWNSKFDLAFLESSGYVLPPPELWEDAMVVAAIADERVPNALQVRADRLFPEDDMKEPERRLHAWIIAERKRRRKLVKDGEAEEYVPPTYADVPDEIMYPYASADVVQTRMVRGVYQTVLDNDPVSAELYELERGTLRALYAMERRGIPIDRRAAVNFEQQLLGELEPKTERVRELAGKSNFNPNAPRQIEEALRRRGADLSLVSKTKSGKSLSMDDENLQAADDELADAVRDWRSTNKMYGTYVKPMLHSQPDDYGIRPPFLGPDDRIHASFNQVGARTGRMSSSAPNMQNWHRDDLRLRYLVTPRDPDYVLVASDLDAIEMRLFAAFAGEGPLLEAVRSGQDMHILAADMVGIEDYVRASGYVESRRQRGKTFNYSMAYGAGVRSLRKKFYVNQKQARAMIARYKAAFPEVQLLQDTIEAKLYERGFIQTPWGRKHRVDPRDAYKGTNYLVQGTAADMLKDSLVRIHDAGIPVIAAVHDEIVAEVRREDAEEAARVIQTAMTDHPRITGIVPIDAEAEIIDRWSWAKDPTYVPEYDRA